MSSIYLNKKYIIELFYIVAFFIINYTASFSSSNINTYYSLVVIIIAMIFNLIFSKKKKKTNNKIIININFYTVIISLIILFALISFSLNYRPDMYNKYKIIHYLILFAIIPIFCKTLIRINEYMNIILYSLIASSILMIPFTLTNININQFNNSAIGLLILGIALITIILDSRLKFIYRIIYVIWLGVIILAMSYTESRTTMITLIFVIFAGIYIAKPIDNKNRYKNLFRNLFMIILLIYTILTLFSDKIFAIINKFHLSIYEHNLLSSRNIIWKYILERVNLFGHGLDFYTYIGYTHAHNTYIGIMGIFGIFVFILFLFYSFISLINSIKIYKYNYAKNPAYLFPLLINISFIIVSLAEDIINHPKILLITILYFLVNQLYYLDPNLKTGDI